MVVRPPKRVCGFGRILRTSQTVTVYLKREFSHACISRRIFHCSIYPVRFG